MAKCVRCGANGLTLKVDFDGLCQTCHEHKKAEAAEETARLQAFYDEYKIIPDAESHTKSILGDAYDKADRIVREADEYARSTRLAAETEASEIMRKAEEGKSAAEYVSAVTIAELNEKLSALLKDAAGDFHFRSRTVMSANYAKERKEQSELHRSVEMNQLTPSAFRKMARKQGFVAFDLETTGLSPKRDRIIEIGAIRYQEGEAKESFHTLINPGKHIPESASEINHIYDDMVADAPAIEEALPAFVSFISGMPVVAHNAGFDVSFIETALVKADLTASIDYADSLQMARKAYPDLPNHKLGTVAEYIGFRNTDQHRALGDCEALGAIVLACMEE